MADRPFLHGIAIAVTDLILMAEVHVSPGIFLAPQREVVFRDIRQVHFDEHVGTGLDGIALGAGLGFKILHTDGQDKRLPYSSGFCRGPRHADRAEQEAQHRSENSYWSEVAG
jgi:hypothetical protein